MSMRAFPIRRTTTHRGNIQVQGLLSVQFFSFLFSLCLVKQKHIYFYCVWEKNQNNCNTSAVFHQNFVKLDCWIDNIE